MTTISLFGLTIYGYGLAVAAAVCVGLIAAMPLLRRAHLKPGTLSWFALLALPLCVLCARLGYCLIRFGWFFQKGIGWFFDFTDGGFVLYGALAGGFLAAFFTAKITRQSFGRLLDTLAAPAALTIALARLAEGLAGEGYGWDMETWFTEEGYSLFLLDDAEGLFFFPLGHYRASWDTWYWAVYVLEALAALVIFCVLLRTPARRDGDRAAAFVLYYASMQALFESMRQDSVLRWGFVRVSQVLSAVAVAGVLVYWCVKTPGQTKKRILLHWGELLACVLLVIAMEFGVEKKIVWLEWFPVSGCYLIMFLCCLGLIASVLPMRHSPRKA